MATHTAPAPPRHPGVVSLRPLRAADAPNVRRWMQDAELVSLTVLVPGPEHAVGGVNNPEAVEKYLNILLTDPGRLSFAICLDGVHVGNAGLKNLEEDAVEAECFLEVGEPHLRGRGIGRRAMELLLDHVFHRVGLRAVNLTVFEFNHAAIHLYETMGFRHEGRTGWHWDRGVFHQVLGMRLERARRQR